MTQRKPTDKEIEEMYSHVTDNVEPEGTPALLRGQWNQVVDLMQKAAKWARDYDPWHYVEDGELPELEGSSGRYAVSDDVWAWIVSHGKPCIMDYHWDKNEGYYWEDDDEGDKYKWDAVHCWQPIVEPQK